MTKPGQPMQANRNGNLAGVSIPTQHQFAQQIGQQMAASINHQLAGIGVQHLAGAVSPGQYNPFAGMTGPAANVTIGPNGKPIATPRDLQVSIVQEYHCELTGTMAQILPVLGWVAENCTKYKFAGREDLLCDVSNNSFAPERIKVTLYEDTEIVHFKMKWC